MTGNCVIRPATLQDRDFLVEAIIGAEKSGTDHLGLATLFGLTEEEVRNYLAEILEEEVDGCELSVNSFLLAETEGKPVAAAGGWIEGENEEHLPSALLKSNLLGYVLPAENLAHIAKLSEIVRDIQIEREVGTYQIEYVYVRPDMRGYRLAQQLLEAHAERAPVHKMQVQAFANNPAAVRMYEKCGFKIAEAYRATHPHTADYLPGQVKLVLEKILK